MHFAVFTVYSRIAYLLRVGGTLIFAPEAECDLRRFLLRTRPTATTVLPHHLHGLLAALPPPDGTRRPLLPALNLAAIGAKLPDHLRSWALDRLCGTISEGYGANEIGAICRFDRTGSGAVHRSVTLEVLDADGQPAAFGEAGEIRLRSTGMVRGYVNDPAASAAMFRDGWFYPGDLGILTEAGTLRLVGRRQDVLNIGGAKRSCAELESQVLRHAPESDVAVLQRDGGVASSLVYVCVAGPAAADPDRLARAVEPAMECQFTMVALPAIPRTAQGKIRREALHDMLFGRPAPARAAPRREALLTTDN
jgi:acyl-coenzyme A synthetase/AMP-(fatty) acid ligase